MSETLKVEDNHVVHFHYEMLDEDGNVAESSGDGDPAAALIGHENLMPGLEKAMAGRTAGEQFEVTLAPEDAFGLRQEGRTQRVSKKYLSRPARLKAGMQTRVQTDNGPRAVTVLKVGGKFVDVDLNHPMAGKNVTFKVNVVEVREASAEEISHRHVHGAGGHHH